MSFPRATAKLLLMASLTMGARVALAQSYPSRPIRIVTSAAGGGADIASRLVANALSGPIGQPVVVENVSAVLPGITVAKAAPDGYTVLLDATSFWIMPLLQETAYDPIKDFAAITMIDKAPLVMVVHPSVPVNSLKELIALAKAKPGSINYGSPPPGSTQHLATEMFKYMAGVNMEFVAYNGTGPAVVGLMGGQVQMMISTAASVADPIKAGKLKALAVSSLQASPLFPGLPPISSAVPGYEFDFIQGMFAPAKTPPAIINRLNQEIVRALQNPDLKGKFVNLGMESAGTTPEQFSDAVKASIAKWAKVIKETNIHIK